MTEPSNLKTVLQKTTTILVPTTSDGSNSIPDQAIRKLGRNLDEALKRATQLLCHAEEIEIERAIRTLQLIKGKTYAKALLKENGKIINEVAFDIGISLMLRKGGITQAELELWYDEAEKKKFEGHIFQPLPDKADAWGLFQSIRQKLSSLSFVAQNLIDLQQKRMLPPSPSKITHKAAKTALELGMWSLLNKEQREEIIFALDWDEIPKPQKIEFFFWLPESTKAKILALSGNTARENATCAEHERLKSAQLQLVEKAPAQLHDAPSAKSP